MDFLARQDSRFLDSTNGPRKIRVFRNGDYTIVADIILKPGLTFQNLKAEILAKLGFKDKGAFRLFNSEGLELYDDYIPLIKDQESLYASFGEDFDQATSLGDYIEIDTLGQGGFGKVVLVEHRETKKLFAAKYVDARKYGLASLIDMVFSEAELLKNLKHRGIVEILSFFKLKDLRVVFFMEYLEGGELGDYLKAKGSLSEDETRELFRQLVDAVHFCHMNKIIHRDLKLENILFESKGGSIIKVVDFGIAGLYSGYKFDVSDAGSLRYMAPEVLTGKNRAANPAIDVWSMGCILYALLHGEPPFTGTKKEIIDSIIKGEYKIDPKVKSRISVECIDLIKRMLVVDYNHRISTFDIKNHPWLTGETLDPSLIAPEEEKEKEQEDDKKKGKSNRIRDLDAGKRKELISMKALKEKHGPNSFALKSKNSAPELKVEHSYHQSTFKMPGQNTLKRAISRETRYKTDTDNKTPKKTDVRFTLPEYKLKEGIEALKNSSAHKRMSAFNTRDQDQNDKNKSLEKL